MELLSPLTDSESNHTNTYDVIHSAILLFAIAYSVATVAPLFNSGETIFAA